MDEKLREAISLYNQGDKSQALKLLAEIVRQEPNNSVAWYGLALCLDDADKKIYCLKKVLTLDPSNKKAQLLLDKLQPSEKPPTSQKALNNPPSPVTNKKSSSNRLAMSILGIIGVVLFCVIAGVAVTRNMGMFSPTPTPTRTRIPPTHTPRPSPTPSIIIGDPINYLPELPDRYKIDYSFSQIDTTLSDGTRLFSMGFRNTQALFQGDLVNVVYFINIYPDETKAITAYRTYVRNSIVVF